MRFLPRDLPGALVESRLASARVLAPWTEADGDHRHGEPTANVMAVQNGARSDIIHGCSPIWFASPSLPSSLVFL